MITTVTYIENIVTSVKKIILENHALPLTFEQHFFLVPASYTSPRMCLQSVSLYEGNQVLPSDFKKGMQHVYFPSTLTSERP